MTEKRKTPPPAKFRLEIVSGANAGAFYEGAGDRPTTIGRSRDNTFPIRDDKTVSRRHAVVEAEGNGFRIRDEQSLAGVKREGKLLPAAGAMLADGDELTLGRTVVRFRLVAAEPPTPGPASPDATVVQKTTPPPAPLRTTEPPKARREAPARPSDAAPPPPARPAPRRVPIDALGPFQIFRDLGDDAGVSHALAVDTRSGAEVLLRRVPASQLGWFGKRKFLRACEDARRIEHPALLAPVDVGQEGSTVYVALPHLGGASVAELLDDCARTLTVEVATWVAREVSGALAFVEERLGASFRAAVDDRRIVLGADGRVALTDVGLPPPLGGPTEARSTRYSAPEEDQGGTGDARSALFALGIVLYELLARARIEPRDKTTLRRIDTVRFEVPTGLARVTMRVIELHPERRFATGGDLEAALTRELGALAPAFAARAAGEWVRSQYAERR